MKRIKNVSQKECGAIAIEAVLGMTIFAIAIFSIMYISLMIRVQSTIQYALTQTAKEISAYYYLLDKIGLASLSSGSSQFDEELGNINQTIDSVIEFSSSIEDSLSGINFDDGVSIEEIQSIPENADEDTLRAKAEEICAGVESMSKDPAGQIKAILNVFGKTMINKALSSYVAPFVCKAVMPKYLSGDQELTNEMLESVGIEGGMSALDFSASKILEDGRTIELVVIYRMNAKKLTWGMVDKELYFKQVAVTAAWICPDGSNTKTLEEIGKEE